MNEPMNLTTLREEIINEAVDCINMPDCPTCNPEAERIRKALIRIQEATIEACVEAVPEKRPEPQGFNGNHATSAELATAHDAWGFNDCRTATLHALNALRTHK